MQHDYAGKSKNYSGSMYFFIPAKCYCRVASALACRSIAKVNRSICELGRGGGCHTSWVHRHAIASHIHATDERLTHTHTHTHTHTSILANPQTHARNAVPRQSQLCLDGKFHPHTLSSIHCTCCRVSAGRVWNGCGCGNSHGMIVHYQSPLQSARL